MDVFLYSLLSEECVEAIQLYGQKHFEALERVSIRAEEESCSFNWGVLVFDKLGDLRQHKFILSKFWRAEVQNQDAGRAKLPPEALRDIPFCQFQILVTPGVLWLVAASVQSFVFTWLSL